MKIILEPVGLISGSFQGLFRVQSGPFMSHLALEVGISGKHNQKGKTLVTLGQLLESVELEIILDPVGPILGSNWVQNGPFMPHMALEVENLRKT